VVTPADLNLGEAELQPRVMMTRQFVPEVQGNCEFLEGEPAQVADELIARLKADSIL
jgi:electron transfer flavoprotein beta subunit